MDRNLLPEFQKFLITNRRAPAKYAPYYAYWVDKFIVFSQEQETKPGCFDLRVEHFLENLSVKNKAADWQIDQARQALEIYSKDFLKSGSDDYEEVINKLRDAIRVKHYSYRTERSYVDWVKRFYDYIIRIKGKDVKRITVEVKDVKDFLEHLAVKQRVAASTQNQAFNALLFLFREVLEIEISGLNSTVRAKRGPKLPVVLTVQEVQELFKYAAGRDLLILQLLYGAGLRIMELMRLRVSDIDFESKLIFIRDAKGDKDRVTVLPQSIKDKLFDHLGMVKTVHEVDLKDGYGEVYLPNALARKYPNAAQQWKWQYVFPASKLSVDPRSGKVRRHHISNKVIQRVVAGAVKRSGITKHATAHTLRHSFATHLLMNGVNVREIQDLLGHKNIETTMIYMHVIRNISNAPKSPLDSLYK